MVRGAPSGIVIAGGGLAGCLAALALAQRRPEIPLLLVEEGDRFGGGRTWTFFDDEIEEHERALVEPLVAHSWPGYYAAFPGHNRNLKAASHAIRGDDLDAAVRAALKPEQYRLGTKVVAVRDDELVLLGGEQIKVLGAIDARGPANLSLLQLGWRRSAARAYALKAPHGLDRPVLVDATVGQADGLRLIQCLPVGERELRIEDVIYSERAEAEQPSAGDRLDAYLKLRGWQIKSAGEEEVRSLPVALGGDFSAFWRVGGARVAKLGYRGGFFHPTSGNSLPDAVRTALLLADQRDFAGAALHDLFEAEAAALWRKREFYRGFNRALFQGSADERLAVYRDFYKLEPGLIARFWSGKLGMLERMKFAKLGK
jgi:lycopene beta-cyclase